ncbi:hypothetical protein ACFWPX_03010 [Nocardia sp. NPDC058518]|uniref:nSTAND1 domain-containing NTPase n=1 Tax=Nocardia sp. NPDC058518 TaxID=3346534 RepID=UPI003659C3AA
MNQRLTGTLQVLLVLCTATLGIVTNYATNRPSPPTLLRWLQAFSAPIIVVLVVVLVVITILSVRVQRPPAPLRKWSSDRSPYPGLEAFTEDEAAVYFGREEMTEQLLRQLCAQDTARFIVVTGASGSGKSSLVQAGLLPRLRSARWSVLPVLTPGTDPILGLAQVAHGSAERLRDDPAALVEMLTRLRASLARPRARLLLAIDQAEELFTLAGQRDREVFLTALDSAVAADPRLRVVMTIRIEYLRSFLDSPCAGLFANPTAIGALTATQLRSVVTEPAAMAGLEFAPGVVNRILDDVETADALPLLGYLLQELYLVSGTARQATLADYQRLGGVAGALARQADDVVTTLHADNGIEPILAVLLKLVTTDGQRSTRRPVPLADLGEDDRRVIDAFIEARLLVTDVAGDIPVAQVAHEALFRQWPPLRQEVEAHMVVLQRRAELERWAADWETSHRNADYLLTGERLRLAREWVDTNPALATDSITALVDNSTRRDLTFLRRVSEGIGEYVLTHVQDYPELSALLSLAALSECPPTPVATRALLAALASSHLTSVLDKHTDAVRHVAWAPNGALVATASRDGTCRIWIPDSADCVRVLAGHSGMVEMAAWSPDSHRIATASRDRTVRVWDPSNGDVLAELTGPTDVVRAVAWSPDGTRIAVGSRDRIIRLFDANTYTEVGRLTGHTDNVLGLAFSPDGLRLASGCHDRTVRIWTLAGGEPMVLTGHEDFVEGVSWSPDGRRLASAGGDVTARIWDTTSGLQTALLRCHDDRVWNVAFSPDGRALATCGGDRTARIWNPDNSEQLHVLRGHTSDVWSVAWSPDGQRLLTGSADTTSRIWDTSPQGGETAQLRGHRGPVRGLAIATDELLTSGDDGSIRAWTPSTGASTVVSTGDGPVIDVSWTQPGENEYLASCGLDKTIRRWSRSVNTAQWQLISSFSTESVPETSQQSPDGRHLAIGGHDRVLRLAAPQGSAAPELVDLDGHRDWITRAIWSPSGTQLVTTSDDRTARVWRVIATPDGVVGHGSSVLTGHENWVNDAAWSPDEHRIVTASADGTARIWDAETGQQVAVLAGHDARVQGVAWSPDGTRIATASYDRTVRTWDTENFTEIAVIGMHRDRLTRVAWLSDGNHLATTSFDGTVRIWAAQIDIDELKARARRRVFRSLTPDERAAHLLPVDG